MSSAFPLQTRVMVNRSVVLRRGNPMRMPSTPLPPNLWGVLTFYFAPGLNTFLPLGRAGLAPSFRLCGGPSLRGAGRRCSKTFFITAPPPLIARPGALFPFFRPAVPYFVSFSGSRSTRYFAPPFSLRNGLPSSGLTVLPAFSRLSRVCSWSSEVGKLAQKG